MLWRRLFPVPPAQEAGRTLYAAAALQARRPAFYRDLGVADTVEGRFELYSLHVALILIRLRGQGQIAADTAQHLFDAYVRSLDDALREMGVSDVGVGRKMKGLGQAFYGRLKAYEEAISRLPDAAALEALLGRTALEGRPGRAAGLLADYVSRAAADLSGQPLEALTEGRVAWPQLVAEQTDG